MNPEVNDLGDAKDEAEGTSCLYWVAAFIIDLVYGGPEEGGWHYQAGTLVVDPEIYQTLGCGPAGFPDNGAAEVYAARMRETLPILNQDRPDITSVLSVGVYEVRILRGLTLPTHFPEMSPRYE